MDPASGKDKKHREEQGKPRNLEPEWWWECENDIKISASWVFFSLKLYCVVSELGKKYFKI